MNYRYVRHHERITNIRHKEITRHTQKEIEREIYFKSNEEVGFLSVIGEGLSGWCHQGPFIVKRNIY